MNIKREKKNKTVKKVKCIFLFLILSGFISGSIFLYVIYVRPDKNSQDYSAVELPENGPGDISSIDVPPYNGEAWVELNNGMPLFSADEMTENSFESYSEPDELGRCGTAYANICPQIMPREERGKIGHIKPSGWKQAKYEGVIDSVPPYLYNRCHLIAFCLAGENANEKNLITGTRYMNVNGMLPWEEKVARYVDNTKNHVLYRVTPDFRDKELVARGVYIEAYSVEDRGTGICFFVYCYNLQPGVIIDYKTGESSLKRD